MSTQFASATSGLGVPTVLVLGARGFVGRHVCRNLAACGAKVIGLGHGAFRQEEERAWGLSQWIESDITLASLTAIETPSSPDAVIHCGGSGAVSYSYSNPLDDFKRSVDTTAAVLEWVRCLSTPKPRVVLVSSAAVYGDQGEVDLTEMAARSPMSPYGFHKLAAESLSDSYARFFGVRVSVVRLFSVYGEGLRKQLLWDAMSKFMRGESHFFGTGHELRDWIHVEDAARLLCAAAVMPQGDFEIYNGGHEHATTREVLTQLAQAGETDIEPLFNGHTHVGNPRRLTSSCAHARNQLGWTPQISLTQGLPRYVRWFMSEAGHPA